MHLLRSDELELAHRFADRESEDKFAGLDWSWDEDVPELARDARLPALPARGRTSSATTTRSLIGDLEAGRLEQGEPLVYARRRMDWLMQPMRIAASYDWPASQIAVSVIAKPL